MCCEWCLVCIQKAFLGQWIHYVAPDRTPSQIADDYFYFDIHSGVGWLFYHFFFRGRTLLREWLLDRYSLHVFIRKAKGAARSLCNYKFMRNMKVCLHKTFLLVVWCYRYKYWWSIGLHGVIISHQWFSVQSTYTTQGLLLKMID